MAYLYTEDALIEQPAIRFFKDVLKWQTLNCYNTFAQGRCPRQNDSAGLSKYIFCDIFSEVLNAQ